MLIFAQKCCLMGTRLKGGRNKTVNHEKSSPKGMAISEQERHIQTRTIQ